MKLGLLILTALSIHSNAAVIFDITESNSTDAAGTSNGINWNFEGSNSVAFGSINDTSTAFSGSNFSTPLAVSDQLHIFNSGTFTFDTSITSTLLYISENSLPTVSFDFGFTPVVLSGDISVSGTGFQVTSTTGGLVRLDGINSNTLSYTSTPLGNGVNIALVVTPVPEPSSSLLVALGALGFALRRRR